MKANKTIIFIWSVFLLIGTVFVVSGLAIMFSVFNYDDKVETIGTISSIDSYRDRDGDIHGTVYVKYEVDGEEYESCINGYSTSYREGKEIKIYYDKYCPDEIGVKSLDFLFLIFPGIGLIFALTGGIGLGVIAKGKLKVKKLRLHGQRIYAEYMNTDINRSVRVNGKCPYNIFCSWNNPEDGKTYIFRSQNLWFDPQSVIADRNITMFPVYINPENKKKYVIDTDVVTDKIVDLT